MAGAPAGPRSWMATSVPSRVVIFLCSTPGTIGPQLTLEIEEAVQADLGGLVAKAGGVVVGAEDVVGRHLLVGVEEAAQHVAGVGADHEAPREAPGQAAAAGDVALVELVAGRVEA